MASEHCTDFWSATCQWTDPVRSFEEAFEEEFPQAGFEERKDPVRMVVEKIEVDRGASKVGCNLWTLAATKETENPGHRGEDKLGR